MRNFTLQSLLTFTLLPSIHGLIWAQGNLAPHPVVAAVHTNLPPTVDGHFGAEEWKNASVFENFTQVVPSEGAPPTEKTRVHVLFDSENLYLGIQCFDSAPDEVIAKQMQKEGNQNSDDLIEIVLDPFADQRNGFYFAVTAAGGKRDGLIDQSGAINSLWDGLWIGKAQRNDEGWIVEIALPFRSISFRQSATSWGINFQRIIRRKQETVRWSGATRNQNFLDMIQAGSLSQIVGIKQGIGLTLKPYSSVFFDTGNGATRLRPGFDMAYKLTPSTTAIITVNTDFAESEVDDLQINLSRFPLFFPEKRSFFLQDTSVFSFGGIGSSPLPFYSRRIGLVRGKQKNILAGAKVTGREGILNFGFLDVEMNDDPDLGKKNLSVGRFLVNVFDQSTAGVIFTHGDPATTGKNTIAGSDFNYQNSHFLGDKLLRAHLWGMGSISTLGPISDVVPSGSDKNDFAAGGAIHFPNDKFRFSLTAGRYGENFRPTLGFLQRPSTYEFSGSGEYRFRTNGFFRSIEPHVNNNTFLDLDGSLQTSSGETPAVRIEDKYGDALHMDHFLTRDVLKEPDDLVGNITLPAGTYQFSRFRVSIDTSLDRAVSANLFFAAGAYYSGVLTEGNLGLTWKPSRHFSFSAKYGQGYGSLPQGEFIIRLLVASANIVVMPELSWNTRVQWDSVSKAAGLNSRIRYEISPGQEAFLLVSQGFDVDDEFKFSRGKGELSAKLGMTFTF